MIKFPLTRRLFATAALLLAPATPTLAQSAPATAPAAATAVDADPALWVVRDADTTIYLFGTVHALRPGLSWFDEAVADAFNASSEVIFEIPQDDDPAAMQSLIGSLGTAQDGRTLSSRLGEQERAVYSRAMEGLGLPPAAFEQLEPWVPGVLLSVLPLMQRGYDPAQGAERILFAAATAAGKRVGALETPREQLGFFDALPEKAQIKLLVEAAELAVSQEDKTATMINLWATGNADDLGRMINAEMEDDAELRDALLTRRNANWTQWIRTRMDQPGTVFIAVGAGHLAGNDSVQSMLTSGGITVTRLNY
ncbi:TraB/GumN family protein [Sphingomonas lacunae]|uniref:TraB/GumN family protein n=1 Tax=Sphingomonas lacunae TaxID=2698828 RepID=A0A6M4AX65_9SPHN|nr:TraB/GumN family protein [Sphingomonas lacunae]QJQ32942.1 TraB/GumN family protein [Sphingomonas lacunae]